MTDTLNSSGARCWCTFANGDHEAYASAGVYDRPLGTYHDYMQARKRLPLRSTSRDVGEVKNTIWGCRGVGVRA